MATWYGKGQSTGHGLVIEEDTGRSVAVVYDDADTAIVSAAPEMCEVLKLAEQELTELLRSRVLDSTAEPFHKLRKIRNAMQNAITKAEGK